MVLTAHLWQGPALVFTHQVKEPSIGRGSNGDSRKSLKRDYKRGKKGRCGKLLDADLSKVVAVLVANKVLP